VSGLYLARPAPGVSARKRRFRTVCCARPKPTAVQPIRWNAA